jgi:hypothetical protein
MLLALAFSFTASSVPHTELPSFFSGNRALVMPRVVNSTRRLVLWVDSDGSGFLRSKLVDELHLQKSTITVRGQVMQVAYLPPLEENGFPPVTGNHGALPILNDTEVANDPIFNGLDIRVPEVHAGRWSVMDDA